MNKLTYSEKLKDPRWQRKRLEIMQRDDFACRHCGNKEKTLNVHHLSYKAKTDVWDYEPDNLVTLCEICHENAHLKERWDKMQMTCFKEHVASTVQEAFELSLYGGRLLPFGVFTDAVMDLSYIQMHQVDHPDHVRLWTRFVRLRTRFVRLVVVLCSKSPDRPEIAAG